MVLYTLDFEYCITEVRRQHSQYIWFAISNPSRGLVLQDIRLVLVCFGFVPFQIQMVVH